MKTVSIKEAKDKLTALAREAEAGATIVVTRNGKPAFDIVPHKPQKQGLDLEAIREHVRKHGKVFTYVAPDFDDPLPEDFLITPETD